MGLTYALAHSRQQLARSGIQQDYAAIVRSDTHLRPRYLDHNA